MITKYETWLRASLIPGLRASVITPTSTIGFKAQTARGGLRAQVSVLGTDLHQSYGPQILPAPALHPICIGNVNRQTIGIVAQGDHFAVLIVLHSVVNASGRLTLAPDAYLKALVSSDRAGPAPLKLGRAVGGLFQRGFEQRELATGRSRHWRRSRWH